MQAIEATAQEDSSPFYHYEEDESIKGNKAWGHVDHSSSSYEEEWKPQQSLKQ